MSNRLFLVCSAHPTIEDAICIADRQEGKSRYYCASNCRCLKCACADKARTAQNKFFEKHANCGVDNFTVAYHRPKGWDVATPAPAVASAVRVAIAIDQIDHPAGADWREPKH